LRSECDGIVVFVLRVMVDCGSGLGWLVVSELVREWEGDLRGETGRNLVNIYEKREREKRTIITRIRRLRLTDPRP
jgi:hypothetical protein